MCLSKKTPFGWLGFSSRAKRREINIFDFDLGYSGHLFPTIDLYCMDLCYELDYMEYTQNILNYKTEVEL